MTMLKARPTLKVAHAPPWSSAFASRWQSSSWRCSSSTAYDGASSFRASSSRPRATVRHVSWSDGTRLGRWCGSRKSISAPPGGYGDDPGARKASRARTQGGSIRSLYRADRGRRPAPLCSRQGAPYSPGGALLLLALHQGCEHAHAADHRQRPRRQERRAHHEVVVRFREARRPLLDAPEVRVHADQAVEGEQRAEDRQRRARRPRRDEARNAGRRQRRSQREGRPHPLVAKRALVVLEVDLERERRRGERRRRREQPLHPALADILERAPDQAAHRSTSFRFSSSPLPARERSGRRTPASGSGTPSSSRCSTRTWSWKYSRWRRRSTAQKACAEIAGAQCAETSSEWAFARPEAERRPVMPPQRVTSACRQSTAPTRLRKSAGT